MSKKEQEIVKVQGKGKGKSNITNIVTEFAHIYYDLLRHAFKPALLVFFSSCAGGGIFTIVSGLVSIIFSH